MAINSNLKENYTTAPSNQVEIHTIHLQYNDSNNDSNNTPNNVRYANTHDDPVNTIQLTEENGTTVNYERRWFEISIPSLNDRGAVAGKLQIENVDLAITDIINEIAGTLNKITLTYRIYLSTDLTVPQINPPPLFYLTNAVISVDQVRFQLVHPNLVNRSYPHRVYTVNEFPQLIGFSR